MGLVNVRTLSSKGDGKLISIRSISIIIALILMIPFGLYGAIGLSWIDNFTGLWYAGWSSDPLNDITFTRIPNEDVSTGYVIITFSLGGFVLYNLGYLMAKRHFKMKVSNV